MSRLHRSIFFSAAERYGSLLLFLLSTAVLARLLTPEEFGTYAVVNALTAVIAASFQEFGGANYLIQKPALSEQNIRTAFTITFVLSVLIGAALFVLRDPLAAFFSREGLRIGITVSVLNFLTSPFAMTISALFRRDLQFGAIATCNLAGNAITAAVSIALAALNYSFMAPIWGMLIGNLVTTVFLIGWRNNFRIFRPSLFGYADVVAFGVYSSGVVVINVFYNLAPQLFLARILDFAAVGLYSRAISVTQVFDKLVTQVLGPVIMPAILAHTKSGGDLRRIYLDSVASLAAVQWPFLLFVAIMANPIILVWLGPTWAEVVPLVRMLCIAYLSLFAACLTYPVLVAVGRVRDALVSSLISLPPSLLVIFIASFISVQAVAASALLTLPLQAFVAFHYLGRHLAIRPADFLRATLKSAIVTFCSAACVLICAAMIEAGLVGPTAGLFLAGISAAAGWWLGMALTEHPLQAHVRAAVGGIAFAVQGALLAGLHTRTARRKVHVDE